MTFHFVQTFSQSFMNWNNKHHKTKMRKSWYRCYTSLVVVALLQQGVDISPGNTLLKRKHISRNRALILPTFPWPRFFFLLSLLLSWVLRHCCGILYSRQIEVHLSALRRSLGRAVAAQELNHISTDIFDNLLSAV